MDKRFRTYLVSNIFMMIGIMSLTIATVVGFVIQIPADVVRCLFVGQQIFYIISLVFLVKAAFGKEDSGKSKTSKKPAAKSRK
ncbi:MAG: hypothetical protein LBT45_02400 [Rickettsiales bacterium]|jgi:hypothetical protein|nr:hypothetical protein [Rickettsiales bacterium]